MGRPSQSAPRLRGHLHRLSWLSAGSFAERSANCQAARINRLKKNGGRDTASIRLFTDQRPSLRKFSTQHRRVIYRLVVIVIVIVIVITNVMLIDRDASVIGTANSRADARRRGIAADTNDRNRAHLGDEEYD